MTVKKYKPIDYKEIFEYEYDAQISQSVDLIKKINTAFNSLKDEEYDRAKRNIYNALKKYDRAIQSQVFKWVTSPANFSMTPRKITEFVTQFDKKSYVIDTFEAIQLAYNVITPFIK